MCSALPVGPRAWGRAPSMYFQKLISKKCPQICPRADGWPTFGPFSILGRLGQPGPFWLKWRKFSRIFFFVPKNSLGSYDHLYTQITISRTSINGPKMRYKIIVLAQIPHIFTNLMTFWPNFGPFFWLLMDWYLVIMIFWW